MAHIKYKTPEEVEEQYRADMTSIVQAFIDHGKYPSIDTHRHVWDIVESLLCLNPEYVTAACNFMGYPISYNEVCAIMEDKIEQLLTETLH